MSKILPCRKKKSTVYNTSCTSYNEKATAYNGLGTSDNEKVTVYNDVTTAYNEKITINNENAYHKAGMAFHKSGADTIILE